MTTLKDNNYRKQDVCNNCQHRWLNSDGREWWLECKQTEWEQWVDKWGCCDKYERDEDDE